MPEYDAFGREIGEDTLAGWRTSPAPAPVPPSPSPSPRPDRPPPKNPEPSPVAAPPEAAAPRGAPPVPRAPRRRPRVVSRLIIILVVLVVGGNLVAGALTKVQDTIDGIPDFRAPDSVTAPRPAPVGLQPGSLIRPAAFAAALKELDRRELGRLKTLRLAPERIDATFLTPRTTLLTTQLTHEGEFRRFGESGAGFGGIDTIPLSKLDPGAPRRLVRAAAERLGRSTDRIDYLVPLTLSGKLGWGAYFKGGATFLGDARGHITRRIS